MAAPVLSLGLSSHGLGAQAPKAAQPIPMQLDVKTPRQPDPIKGYGEVTAVAPAALPAATRRKVQPGADRVEQAIAQGPSGIEADRVYYDAPGDGRTWASGATYKASFGPEGFTYIPFLGSAAPRNYPVHFALAGVRVGDGDVALDSAAPPVREGDRVVYDRGPVREIYDLSARGIEQTFVVDGTRAGDVIVDLRVTTDLVEDGARAGVQFGNELGFVAYGDAFVVHGTAKQAIATTLRGDTISLRVPAAQRASGDVVIDPVISTGYTSMVSTRDFAYPDVAFDATVNRYLVVWQSNFSAADVDIFGEMRDLNGNFVSASLKVIDNSTQHWSRPRVANLNAYDRFLVVAERFDGAAPAGQQYAIWGRTQDAASPFTQSSQFLVSGGEVGNKREPDVGGDPNLTTPTYWTVVYTRELTATDSDIHVRQVMEDATPRGSTIYLENSSNTVHRRPQISQSNGTLGDAFQRWLVVYNYKFSATDWDVVGATLTWDGQVAQAPAGIDTSSRSDVAPSVSSPTASSPFQPTFGLTFVTELFPYSMHGKVVSNTLASIVPTTNLSGLLGHGNVYFPRIETDGCRFVVTYADGQPGYAATLGVVAGSFVVHEQPQMLGIGHDAFDLNIAARGVAGGANTGYGIVFADQITTPSRIVFSAYEGHGQGGYNIRPTGCNGLGISASGRALLGRTTTATLTGTGTDLVGMLLGLPLPALNVCPGCRLGVDITGPIVNLPNLATMNVAIPCTHAFVGATVSVQGYAVGSGTCLGVLRLGDTLDITIQ